MKQKVLIIGAGIGGLSTALRLTSLGYDVEIIDKNKQAGGRLNQIVQDGFTFDTGPSFFSMSYEFRELAENCKMKMPFEIIELDPLYAVHFAGKKQPYILHKNIQKLSAQFADIEPDFEKKMTAYLAKGKELFDGTVDLVVRKNYDSVIEYLLTLMKSPPSLIPILFRNFWQQVTHYFSSSEVQQIVSLVAFFLGRTPFDTPAVYSLLSYTEFVHDGYYNVKGGMYKITEGYVNELKSRGVQFHYNVEITDYINENEHISFIDTEKKRWTSDIYVINADAALFRGQVFKRPTFSERALHKKKWTMAPLTFYVGINRKLPDLYHHNYYLGANFKEYAKKIFLAPEIVEKPYYYVNILSHNNPDCAPDGCEGLFFVCPVPDLRFKKSWDDSEMIVNNIIDDFSMRIGIEIQKHIVSKTVYTPVDWKNKFNLYMGSGLGLSHDLMQIGAFRPKNYDEHFKNVFYVGASTIPGTGLPMAIISSKLVVERITKQYGLIY